MLLMPDHVGPSQEMVKTLEGPYCPGIAPQRTLLAPFTIVVSYRHYRLRDTRATLHVTESESVYRVKRIFDALFPSFQPLDGTNPIKLLQFLASVRDGLGDLHVPEGLASLTISYYLMGSAKDMCTNQVSPGVRSSNSALASSWPFVVHALIKRYLLDDVLQRAYEKVTDARQKPEEDESKFADRLIGAARDCCNVFEDRELVNYYIRGLLPSTRDAVTEAVRQLPVNEQGYVTVARRVAHAEGNTFRARRTQSDLTPVKFKSRGHVMTMPEPAETTGRHVPTS